MPKKNELPFATREPDVFQAIIVTGAGDIERKVSIARNGTERRIDFDPGTDTHRAVLKMADKEYQLYFKRKAYAERGLASGGAVESELSFQLMSVRDYTRFEEVRRDGSVIQFRAQINGTSSSDVVIYFDEAIGLPVKQEFYSVDGAARTLRYWVELRDFQTAVDPSVFKIPQGFRKE